MKLEWLEKFMHFYIQYLLFITVFIKYWALFKKNFTCHSLLFWNTHIHIYVCVVIIIIIIIIIIKNELKAN